jgi:type I restriction enzyme S subunit
MKDSGIEWLGEMPAHWRTVPLKHLCSLLKDGTHLPPQRVDEGIPLLSVRNLNHGKFGLRDDDSKISVEDYRYLCRAFIPQADDVLLAIVGATLGKAAVIPNGLGEFHIQRSVAIFRTRPPELNHGFLYLIFQSKQFKALLWQQVGFSAQPGIYLGTLQNFRVPVPPSEEQSQIVRGTEAMTRELAKLISEAEHAIDLLQERRTALISAAVTGQIDVRNLAERQAAA